MILWDELINVVPERFYSAHEIYLN